MLGQTGCVGGGKHLSFHDLAGSAAVAAALGWHPQGSHNHHECSSSQPLVTCQLLHLSDPSSRPQCPLERNASGIVGRFHVVAEGPARYLPSAMSDSLAISGNLWIIYRTTRLESGLDGAQVSSGVFVLGLAHEVSRAMGPSSNLQPRPLQPRRRHQDFEHMCRKARIRATEKGQVSGHKHRTLAGTRVYKEEPRPRPSRENSSRI